MVYLSTAGEAGVAARVTLSTVPSELYTYANDPTLLLLPLPLSLPLPLALLLSLPLPLTLLALVVVYLMWQSVSTTAGR